MAKSELIGIRVSKDEMLDLWTAALDANTSLSTFIREGMPIVRWFGPGGPLGQLDEVRDHIWLNTELAANEGELIKTIGHETHHATEYHAHTRFDCKAAEYGGDRFLEVWNRYIGDLHAQAAASGIAREPFQRLPFPGDASFDAAFDSHADVTVEARRPQAARAEFGFERGGAP